MRHGVISCASIYEPFLHDVLARFSHQTIRVNRLTLSKYTKSTKLEEKVTNPIYNMNEQIKESDWKVFKKLYPLALERFYDRAVNELQKIVAEDKMNSGDKYHKIYETVQKRDKKLAKLFDGAYSRSAAFIQLISYYKEELITQKEVNQLSKENRDRILAIVEDE